MVHRGRPLPRITQEGSAQMAHRSTITCKAVNVGIFDQSWRYDYTVTWLAGNASIREVKIDKTNGAGVAAPLRFGFQFPFFFRDPRIDLAAPTSWTLIVRPAQFEFMIQPPPMAPLPNYIPPLIAAPPPPPGAFVPAPPPAVGIFRVFSIENPKTFPAYTIDHLNARFPAAPNPFMVDAPNSKPECASVTAFCEPVANGYRYTYALSSDCGDLWQLTIFLPPDVSLHSIQSSDPEWHLHRVGFDQPISGFQADGTPGAEERGIAYFGSFTRPVAAGGPPAVLSFVSESEPGLVWVLGNRFAEVLVGPASARKVPR
jgi:hypothetical protein